jgi:hypothetical protein
MVQAAASGACILSKQIGSQKESRCSANGICKETEATEQSIHVLKTESIIIMSYEMDIAIKDAGFMSVKERNS